MNHKIKNPKALFENYISSVFKKNWILSGTPEQIDLLIIGRNIFSYNGKSLGKVSRIAKSPCEISNNFTKNKTRVLAKNRCHKYKIAILHKETKKFYSFKKLLKFLYKVGTSKHILMKLLTSLKQQLKWMEETY